MARLTDAQIRNAREQALRSTRRAERKFDTRVEVMERRLDRAIENKERITIGLMESVLGDYLKLVLLMRDLEKAMTDALLVFSSTQ